MIKILKLISVVAFIFIASCGYQPIFISKNFNFQIDKISTSGDEKINRIILKTLENLKKQNNTDKKYSLEINTSYNRIVSSKDTKGNPKTFRIEIISKVLINENNKLKLTKNFIAKANYNNTSSKFKLKKYEENLKNNLTNKIVEDIIIYLQGI